MTIGRAHLTLLLAVILIITPITPVQSQEHALKCEDHPAYNPSIIPPLLRSWRYAHVPAMNNKMLYHPRHFSRYNLKSDPSSTKFLNTDLLYLVNGRARPPDLATLYLNRRATVYLFVGARTDNGPHTLASWTSVGYATLTHPSETVVNYGIFQNDTLPLPPLAYVFSKRVSDKITIPTPSQISRAVPRLQRTLRSHVRLAEYDGSPSRMTGRFQGKSVSTNKKCPKQLHDQWRAKHPDRSDPQIRDRTFAAWHPPWDPCFWCAYGHEHGSSSFHLMKQPRTFGYTALKNRREHETHAGFKDFVFKIGNYWVLFGIHAHTSELRRVTEQYHTAILMVVHKSGEKMAEITHKADYGFLAAKGKNGLVPLRPIDRIIESGQARAKGFRRFRTVNVINMETLDSRFKYKDRQEDILRGQYEDWETSMQCVNTLPFGEINVDFKNPITGVRSVSKLDEAVYLGKVDYRNLGTFRSINLNIIVGSEHCKFEGEHPTFRGGVFYTNPDGTKLVRGPSPSSVWQYIKPGFELHIQGKFEVSELGLGLFEDGAKGHFLDHGFGIDPYEN